MPLTLKEGIICFTDTIINNTTHRDYTRVNKIAKDYTAYVTGENIAEKLRRFVPRESTELFNQRVELTQVITPDITNSIMNPMYKVGRTSAVKKTHWKDSATTIKNKKILDDVAAKFNGDLSVEDYLTYRMVDLDSSDPNSFIVVEFEGSYDPAKPDEKVMPYPYEVNSKEAVNYEFSNDVLQFLIVKTCISINSKKGYIDGDKYTIYLQNDSIVATQIDKDMFPDWLVQNKGAILLDSLMAVDKPEPKQDAVYYFVVGDEKAKAGTKKAANNKFYEVKFYAHKAGVVPAKRVGCKKDLTTRSRTCVPIIHPAKSYLEKSIKTISEFDLTNCLHVFPQKIQYTDACLGQKLKKGGYIGCNNGSAPDGQSCTACNGTGYKVHKSAQDLIQVRMPKDIKDAVSLENILVYKYPPIDLLKFQQEFGFDKLKHYAQSAVYNSDVYSNQEIAVTATEKKIDLDAVYDTLSSFAKNWSAMYIHMYTCIAAFTDLSEGLVLGHTFPADFKMKAFEALLQDLKTANENSAPSHVKKAITNDITRRLYRDSPFEILKIETKDRYFPFSGKNQSEIEYVLGNDLTTRYNKILYAHFDLVFSEIEYDTREDEVNFYDLEPSKQRELITKKVNDIMAAVDLEDFSAAQKSFKFGIDTPAPPDPNAPVA